MRKLLLIAWKDVALRFTDPAVLCLTIAAPLLVTLLIDLAFGDLFLSRGIPNPRIPVGVVNSDQGGEWGNFGDLIVAALHADPSEPAVSHSEPFDLLDVRRISSEREARQLVRQEGLVAAVLIPPDFSASWSTGRSPMEIYLNDTYDFRGEAFACMIEALGQRLRTAEAAVYATVEGLAQHPHSRARLREGVLDEFVAEVAFKGASPESNPVKIKRLLVGPPAPQVRLTHYLAAALGISFTGLTALMGSASLLEEEASWTLQRMQVTPTWPGVVLGGKTLGTFLNGTVQMVAMIGGVALWERWQGGSPGGASVCGLSLVLLTGATVASATGLGVTIAGLANSYVQAANYGRAVVLLSGLLGGIFLPVSLLPRPLDTASKLTFQYWAMDGFLKAANGGSPASLLPHLSILLAMASLSFLVGGMLLRRRTTFL